MKKPNNQLSLTKTAVILNNFNNFMMIFLISKIYCINLK